ncbi:Fanconi anemia group A protein [Sphaeramia orbicularis]|uniref:Fanconi anemia group A protein n=1 Tax=Sphaeramia orbicularis TaxID=375764 RepID=UPI00117CD6C7|nr:Fanconi anemia group A protein [Sphaeramia orbicularis]
MSLSATCDLVSQKRTVSSLLAGRVLKKAKHGDVEQLQEAAIQLLEQQQNLCTLLREVGNANPYNIFSSENEKKNQTPHRGIPAAIAGSLVLCELRRQAVQLGVPVPVLSVKIVLERLMEITAAEEEDDKEERELLTSSQRVQLRVLLESVRDLLSHGALCPKLLWQEYRKAQRLPKLEVVFHLHSYNILALKYILESDEGVRSWLVPQLKALCCWTPAHDGEEARQVQHRVLSTVVGVLVGIGFEQNHDPPAPERRMSLLCSSVLDDMLLWLLDIVEKDATPTSTGAGAQLWIGLFDASLCGVSVSAEGLQRFFTHSLTQTLTYKPRLTASDAITLQNEWTFAKSSQLLTCLFRQLAVIFDMEQLLRHLQQVLEIHEVNWKHVLCFLSTLLIYNPCSQASLRELLSKMLSSAFESFDLETVITAFLLARQGALEGAAIFPSYSDWFKMSFGGSSGHHTASKRSLVFLLKFLSDLVPFEPSQYLKVHILHPPYVPVKHRSLLMNYVSLAKTRLDDLKEPVEDMGLYEDVSVSGGSAQAQCQGVQDVEKAVSLFENTGRISATVMEASIFRRPYFLTRFLPALLKPRVLPVKPDARMSFIEALKKADKIPAAQYSSYVESCQRQRQQDDSPVCVETHDDPEEVLRIQLQEFRELVVDEKEGEMSARLSRISHTLTVVFPGDPDELIGQTVVKLHTDQLLSPVLHVRVINTILRNFCQCLLDASRVNPPNKQSPWASRFVSALLGNTQLLSSLLHRLWDLFHHQGPLLSPAHSLGLAVFLVHLHASLPNSPLVQLVPPVLPKPVPIVEALSSMLVCDTHTNMLFCIRLCVAAVCYGICRGQSMPQQQEYIHSSVYKKLLYLIPRLLPEARGSPADSLEDEFPEDSVCFLWSSSTDSSSTWRRTALHLWRHPTFQQLQHQPQYQLPFSEWLRNELRVQRSEDALSDPERQEYQQWACLELYLRRPAEQGGCGGDVKTLCSHLLNAIMDQNLSDQSLEQLHHRVSDVGTCLPDILSRLQECVYEMKVTELSGGFRGRADLCDFLFEFVSERLSSITDSGSQNISAQLSLQRTLHTWNRVLLSLPAVLFIKVKTEGGRTTLDWTHLVEHVNQHQRRVCSPAGLLSCHLTAHFLKGLLCASVRCGRPVEEFNRAWCQISVGCPLLLVSTVHWWDHLNPLLLSLWRRLGDDERVPDQLQLLIDCHLWASRFVRGQVTQMPLAPPLQLAASLQRALQGCEKEKKSCNFERLQTERDGQQQQVLVFLLFLSVNRYLSALLCPQEKRSQTCETQCSVLLDALVDSDDWLLIFKSTERGIYDAVAMVTPDEFARLMPWAFYSLLCGQSSELLHRASSCPGFVHTAVLCYISLLQLFLDGHTPSPVTESSKNQMAPSQILSHSKRFVLKTVSQMSPTGLSSSQLRQLQTQCADLDPELASALSVHLDVHSLSPEMDFL